MSDHTIEATFEIDTYTITATPADGGTISPSGPVIVSHGGSQTLVITPDEGYHVADVTVDGSSVGAITTHTFPNVTSDHTIEATFASLSTIRIWIEAEEGDLRSPMEAGRDGMASSGEYIWVPNGYGYLSDPSEDGGYAEHTFEVPATANYVIWGRVISNSKNDDSFFVSIDYGDYLLWDTQRWDTETWVWDQVSNRGGSDPVLFYLGAEEHSLIIKQREDGTKIDRILVTNDMDYIPEGLGGEDTQPELPPLEIGEASADHNWKRITLRKSFIDPVVVAKPLSYNEDDPAIVRIRNVDGTGFEIRIQEWDYLDGNHVAETVGYIVMERGRYTLGGVTMVEAGRFDTDRTSSFESLAFKHTFNEVPVVITSVTSFNEVDAVTTRVRNISTNGFEFRINEQELNPQVHATETISYIAWGPSSGSIDGLTFEVNKTQDVMRHKFKTISFDETFMNIPVFLADMQTIDGTDTANLRWENKDFYGVDVKVEEEQSRDRETNHTSEVVGYMLFSISN
jgi:hypothetical protein